LDTEETTGSVFGTPGYFPLTTIWLNGSLKWDVWALAAIICEADMGKDEYLHTKHEMDAKERFKKHMDKKGTSENLKMLM
jgi:hypothetical protein